MARWRREAIARIPELRETIEQSHEVMFLWTELVIVFEKAYREPRNDDLIRRIYDFAKWCESAPRGPDAGRDPYTAVVVAFYEHIPQTKAARDDICRWFTRSQILEGRAVFARYITPEEYESLLDSFDHLKNKWKQ